MKKLLLTTGVLAAVAGSQLGYAACVDSGNPNTTASCASTVTLNVASLVVIKGLDDYDFTDAPGWGGTGATGDDSVVNGALCIGTNNPATGVNVTISSLNGGFEATGTTGGPIAYSVYFDGSGTPVADGTPVPVSGGNLDDLNCATEGFDLNVEFTGAQLLTAVGGVAYSDTVTVSVAPL